VCSRHAAGELPDPIKLIEDTWASLTASHELTIPYKVMKVLRC
jgi:hypothetical protein